MIKKRLHRKQGHDNGTDSYVLEAALSLQLDDLQVCFPSNKLTLGSPQWIKARIPRLMVVESLQRSSGMMAE